MFKLRRQKLVDRSQNELTILCFIQFDYISFRYIFRTEAEYSYMC